MAVRGSMYLAPKNRASSGERTTRYCALPPRPRPALPEGLSVDRQRAILLLRSVWINGTTLRYYFFDQETDGSTVTFEDGSTRFVSWIGSQNQQDVVRAAFEEWKSARIGLNFQEVYDRSEAEIRIGFLFDFDGSWSYIGRDVLGEGANSRTMNFGWSLTSTYGATTARHEIAHSLGLPHEHQNPFAGIVWDEEAVYQYFGGPPNNWTRETTLRNVIQKLSEAEVQGSTWDKASCMHYEFPAGLILEPEDSREGIFPPGTISDRDKQYVRQWYPEIEEETLPFLEPFKSVTLSLTSSEQVDFALAPAETREYTIATFGQSDSVLVLFEELDGDLRFVAGDDDSGQNRNAKIELKLFRNHSYVVRVRLYYGWGTGQTGLMCW